MGAALGLIYTGGLGRLGGIPRIIGLGLYIANPTGGLGGTFGFFIYSGVQLTF